MATTLPDPIDYLDHVAHGGRAYEQRLLDALDLGPANTVLDVGCGPVSVNLAVNRFLRDRVVRHPVVGRQLARLASAADLRVVSVETTAPLPRDFDTADHLLGLSRNAHRAVAAGRLTRVAAERWPAELGAGPFLAVFTLFRVVVSVP
ncbi:hypothetical protein [Saccharothrix sp. Mg75]|uniref:hypothetical protein n=1 Tax=Saccharothrix sp. Mg75 TaxID=3445357 RepID=UPI003EE879C6